MSPALKAVLILAAGYAATLGLVVLVGGAYLVVTGPKTCGALGDALLVLWSIMGVAALASVVAVGAMTWRLTLGVVARLLLAASFAVAICGTLAVLALSLVMVFNC
jgi:hypothetical protein